jgi:hypothetical protein
LKRSAKSKAEGTLHDMTGKLKEVASELIGDPTQKGDLRIRREVLTFQSKDRRKEMTKKIVFLTVLMVFGFTLFLGSAVIAGETVGQYVDDSTIHTQVTAIIVKDPDAHYFKTDVTVTQGDVVLTGFVNSRDTENRLIGKISEIKGVKSVKSLLKLQEKK